MHRIKDIDFGIAFRIKDTIYLNKNLKNYPRLRNQLIKHELEHDNSNSLKLRDIKTDLTGKHLREVKKDYYKFLFKEKGAWKQLLPFIQIEDKWSVDVLMLGIWIIALIMFTLIIFI